MKINVQVARDMNADIVITDYWAGTLSPALLFNVCIVGIFFSLQHLDFCRLHFTVQEQSLEYCNVYRQE